MIARAAALALAATLVACTWFDDGPPDRSCRADRDCFRAQGEVCDPATLTCTTVDAAAQFPFDAAVDASPIDGPAAEAAP